MDWHQVQSISDPSHAGEARRLALRLASRRGLSDVDAGRVALVVTEAATNIVKHAGKGQILLRALCENDVCYGVEVISIDRGPGMGDLARCFEDGYSTAGSPGTGLGAIRRLAPSVEIYSAPGLGTALLAQVISRNAVVPSVDEAWCIGHVRVPAPGESECGDDFAAEISKTRAHILVADGLGHGPEAAKAAAAAVRVFRMRHSAPPEQLLSEMHAALRSTRGAAVAFAMVDLAQSSVQFTGVGNVSGIISWHGGSRHMVTQNGTLGSQLNRIHVFDYPWHVGGCLVIHSDGLTSQLDARGLPGLHRKHPTLMAAVLYRDFLRGRDDATVVVARESRLR